MKPSTEITAEAPKASAWSRLGSLPITSLVQRGAWGLPDQGLLSITNFLTTILIARALSPERFGEFALAIAFINMAMSLGTAAITQPFAVLSARHREKEYNRFLSATFLVQILFVTAVGVPTLLVAAISGALGWHLAALTLMVVPAMATWQIQEFVRQVFYAEGRLRTAFLNDVISYGGQSAGFIVAYSLNVLTPVTGLGILALTSLAAIIVALWSLRKSFDLSFSRRELLSFMREIWGYGRWLLGGVLLTAISTFSMFTMLATFSGAAAVGAFRALITTSAPIRVLVEGAKTSFVPSAARVVENEGIEGLKVYVRRVFLLIGPLIAGYCLLAAMLAGPLLNVLYGDRFDEYAWLLPLFMLSFFLTYITFAIEIGLRARRVTDVLFQVALWGSIGTFTFGGVLVYFFALEGLAVLHLILTPIIALIFWVRYEREMHRAALV